MTAPVLDLRPFAASQTRWLNQMEIDEVLSSTAPIKSGTANGYAIQAQRGYLCGRTFVAIRLSAPDGRVLNLAGPRHLRSTRIPALVTDILSPTVRRVLTSKKPTAAVKRAGAAAIERIIVEGLHCLTEGVNGTPALIRVAAAAEDVDPVEVLSFDAFAVAGVSIIGDGDLSVPDIAILIRNGFDPTTTKDWFGASIPKVKNNAHAKAMAAFRDNGWTFVQMRTARGFEAGRALDAAVSTSTPFGDARDRDVWAWAALTPEDAFLALGAGLTATSAADLKRTGKWDTATLRTLAALRDDFVII